MGLVNDIPVTQRFAEHQVSERALRDPKQLISEVYEHEGRRNKAPLPDVFGDRTIRLKAVPDQDEVYQ